MIGLKDTKPQQKETPEQDLKDFVWTTHLLESNM
jgi:hypothetical protein